MSAPTTPTGDGPPPGPRELPDRYRLLHEIDVGGQGLVYAAHDARLDRQVVIKILFMSAGPDGRDQARRAQREIRITSRLQHQGIVAVHDADVLPDGRPWYAMRRIEGRRFDHWLAHRLDGRRSPDAADLRAVVQVLESVCQTVAYAHHAGYVHCDLKPSNIMVGPRDQAEVQVIDWGAAQRVGELRAGDLDLSRLRIERPAGYAMTLTHVVLGTPAYMPPESLEAGRPVTPAADVYAIGVILYEVMAGRLPYLDPPEQVLHALRDAAPPTLSALIEPLDRDHADLIRIVERAMQRDPAVRQRDCGELADELGEWLRTGEVRRDADVLVERCDEHLARLAELDARREAAREEAAVAFEGVARYAPIERKLPAWRLEDELAQIDRMVREVRLTLEQRLHAALFRDRKNPGAHRLLAALYRQMAEEAELSGLRHEAEALARRVARHDRGEHRAWCRGTGLLNLATTPPGARVIQRQLVAHERRLIPAADALDLGPTPLVDCPMGPGSWLLELHGTDSVIRYPVFITRGSRWIDRAPSGEQVSVDLRGDRGPGECLVPAGWFVSGGDPEASDSLPGAHRWTDAFVVERDPVTNARYLEFVNAIAAIDPERAARFTPQEQRRSDAEPVRPLYRAIRGGYTLPDDDRFDPDVPVTLVDWRCADAFARWRREVTGEPWRLLHALEWEKAARGVDGRIFPWGDYAEPTYANMLPAHEGVPARTPVDRFPTDESVYGVRGMAGNVRDWCGDWYSRIPPGRSAREAPAQGESRNLRGGSFTSEPRVCRLAVRFAAVEQVRQSALGFRLARSV